MDQDCKFVDLYQQIRDCIQCNIDVAVATIVHGVTITSSPGSIPIAPTAATSPEVLS